MYTQKQVWENNNLREIMKNEGDTNTLRSVYIQMYKKEKWIDNENWKIKVDHFDASPSKIQKVSYQ